MAGFTTTAANSQLHTHQSQNRRTLVIAGITHALHDGYTDLIYVLLPVWQVEFALGYGVLAFVRGLYTGMMAGLQIPVGRLAERFGGGVVISIWQAPAPRGFTLAWF